MLSDGKPQTPLTGVRDHLGRPAVKTQRPTALLTCRNRSESPATRSKSRPSDVGFSPSEDQRLDLDSLQKELESKSGVLTFGSETFTAEMDDFINEGLLGSGTCSSVYRMRHYARHDLVMAVKYMRRSSTCQEENKRILMDLNVISKSNDCPYIVQCFGIFFTTGDVWICMEVMPTCLDKLLRDLHRPFPERVIGKITVSITTALDYLKRKHNIMHRDVKPSNMLLSFNGVIKLCDFGISGKLKDSIARSRQLGCIGYMAPERLETPTYDVRADIWSLGISLFELATGSFPYKGTEIEFAIMSKIISDPPPCLPHHIPFTTAFRHFIESCLQKDHRQRPKYRSLMSTEFFCRHNVAPYNVLDWLKGLPLKHLHRSNGDLASAHSSSLGSPNSNSTISPDMLRTLRDASLQDSVEIKESNSVEENRPMALDVVLVAAPSRETSESTTNLSDSTSPVYALGRDSVNSLHSADCDTISSVRTDSSPNASASTVGTMSSLQFHEPLSLASSGYGSMASDESPNSLSTNSRLPSHKYNATTSCFLHSTGHADSKTSQSHAKMIATQRNGEPSFSNKSEQWISTASSSRITKHLSGVTAAASCDIASQADRTIEDSNKFLTLKCSEFPNRGGNSRAVDCAQRSFTPPLGELAKPLIADHVTAPVSDHASRPAKFTQPRSSSVGAQLQRTPAQRWLCKPKFSSRPSVGDKRQRDRDLLTRHPVMSDHRRASQNGISETDSNMRLSRNGHLVPPPVPPHLSHRPCQNSVLSQVNARCPGMDQTEDPSVNIHTHQPYNAGFRLAHRLHTHPIPRHASFANNLPSRGKLSVPALPPHATISTIALADYTDPSGRVVIRGNGPTTKSLQSPRLISRSTSQPAVPRVHNWQSFETDL